MEFGTKVAMQVPATTQSRRPSMFATRRNVRWLGLLAIPVAVTALALGRAQEFDLPLEVERGLGTSYRIFGGRPGSLVSDTWYAPFLTEAQIAARSRLDKARLESFRKVNLVFTKASEGPTPPGIFAARGLLRLNNGETSSALADLRAAVDKASGDADAWNGLAVGYLRSFEKERKATDLLQALDASRMALELSPDSPSSRFNMALVLTHFGLARQAKIAWNRYLDLDPSSSWSTEANLYLFDLSQPSKAELWAGILRSIEESTRPPSQQEIETLVASFPYRSRVWGEEELLGKWAELELSGRPEANETLQWVRPLAQVLATQYKTSMLLDSIERIDSALASGDTTRLRLLAQGHLAYAKAMVPYAKQDLVAAEPLFLEARTAFESTKSPMALWCDFYLGMFAYYGKSSEGGVRLEALRKKIDPHRYGDLLGRVHWMLATVAVLREQPEATVEEGRLAFENLDATLGATGSAFLNVVIAEALGRLGEADLSWQHRLAALAEIPSWNDPRRLHSTLVEAIQMLSNQGRAELAFPFLNELVDNAKSWGNPTAISEALLQRGRIAFELGQFQEAEQALAESGEDLARMPAGKIRDVLGYRLDAERARLLVSSQPGVAEVELSKSIEEQASLGNSFDHLRLLTARAKAFSAQGNFAAAKEDLEEAIGIYEGIRSTTGDAKFRISTFGQAQPAFESYLELLLETNAPPEESFEVAERARSRYLLDLKSASSHHNQLQPISAADLKNLKKDTAVLMYMVLEDKLLVWFADRDHLSLKVVEIAESELYDEVLKLRNSILHEERWVEINEIALRLARHLIGPFVSNLQGIEQLVVIPDRFLQRVPFLALSNPATGRLLIEDFPISIAPSATLLLSHQDTEPSAAGKNLTALVIGEPAYDREKFGELDPLPGARQEAEQVAALYPGSLLLEGTDATEATFLEKAPAFDVIHFAGHAQANNSAIRNSRLLLAPDPGETDGALHAFELPQIFGHARLVVLSACSTLDSTSTDREDQLGLGSAFLAVGTDQVVATLWDLPDQESTNFMTLFHRQLRLQRLPAGAEALRQAALIQKRKTSTAQTWAAYEVISRSNY